MAEHTPTSEERSLVRRFMGDDRDLFTADDYDDAIRIAFRHRVTDPWHTAARMLMTLVSRLP